MKQTAFTALLTGALAAGLLILATGCSDEDSPTSAEEGIEVQIKNVTPPDGAAGVSPSATIAVSFTGPVDTMTVMRNFYFVGGEPMHEWRDSLNHYGGFGMMGMNHTDHMMNWMDSIHQDGEFHWNEAMDNCEFRPDSLMSPDTDYLCLLYEGGMRGHGGGMMGGDHHGDSGYHLYGFTTGTVVGEAPDLISVSPPDQAINIARSAIITLVFDMPMDTHSVISNFHFSGGVEMHEWMDSLGHHVGMGGMGMLDTAHMMEWMTTFEHAGEFHWNGTMDSCQFIPDGSLMPMTDYMIFLNGDMRSYDGRMMDMHHLEYDSYVTHFTTGP